MKNNPFWINFLVENAWILVVIYYFLASPQSSKQSFKSSSESWSFLIHLDPQGVFEMSWAVEPFKKLRISPPSPAKSSESTLTSTSTSTLTETLPPTSKPTSKIFERFFAESVDLCEEKKLVRNTCHFNLTVHFQNWSLQLTLKITWPKFKQQLLTKARFCAS